MTFGWVAGCAAKLEAPPVEITYRESLLGAGNILRVKNLSSEPLRAVEITIRAASGEVSYEEATLAAGDVLEVGWKKLNGFEIPDEAEIAVKAEGYVLAAEATLKDAEDQGEGP